MPSLARSETLKKESGTSTKDKILEILGLVITLDDALFLLLGSLYLVGVWDVPPALVIALGVILPGAATIRHGLNAFWRG